MNMLAPGRTGLRHAVTDAEWQARVDLAAAIRLGYHYGWNRTLSNHISLRVPDQPGRMLMNPYGLGWDEMTASALATVDLTDLSVVSHEEVELAPAGLNFHSGILKTRPDVASTVHCHPNVGVVIASTEDGLVIRDQTSCHLLGNVGTHAFEGFAESEDETLRILEDLGERNLLIMWNHGLLSVGRSLPEAFSWMFRLVTACEVQVKLMSTGAVPRDIPADMLERTEAQVRAKRQRRPYSQIEWQYFLRTAERLDPSFAT